ncbi:MAG: hypothetical protein NTW52_17555 [Planctomycetota bacterium]|nr:hypothetical protein [Planctomycetota bacterium]
MNRWVQTVLCLLTVATLTSLCPAQDVLDELYGSGVHAFFAGNKASATEQFNQAIAAGSQDPRVFFFRGLTEVSTAGAGSSAAQADFEQAAQLEVLGRRGGDVSKALQRIQGPARMEIERARTLARLNSKSKQFELMRQRYEAAASSGVAPSTPATINDALAPGPNPTDPFAGDGKLSKGTPEDMPANADAGTEKTAPAVDPFGDDAPATPAAPAADDPFGAPATPAPAAETDAGSNPFGF